MRIVALAALAVVSAIIGACSNGPMGNLSTSSDSTAKLVVSPSLESRNAGDTVRFATMGDSGPVIWMVSDSRVAAIEQQGSSWALARALHVGTTTITAAHGASAASAVLIVNATHLAITAQPSTAVAGVAFAPPVVVIIADEAGHPVAGANNRVTVTLDSNPSHATLSGSPIETAVSGVATFPILVVQKAGGPYTFTASANGFSSVRSAPFSVTLNPNQP